jgi:hypothetical protein
MVSADTKTITDAPELHGLASTVSPIVDVFHEAISDCLSLKRACRLLRLLRTGNARVDREVRAHAEVVYALEAARTLLLEQGVLPANRAPLPN